MANHEGRGRHLIRTWRLLKALEQRPLTLQQLATDLEVTDRTIRRDLEVLEDAGFSLYDEKHDDGRKRWHLLTKGVTPDRRAA